MARNKPARKASPKVSTKKGSKKKSVARKSKPASSSKSSGTAKKGKAVKAASKPKGKGKASLKKSTGSSKKAVSKKTSAQKSVVTKKKSPVTKKEGPANTKKVAAKSPSRPVSTSLRSGKPKTQAEPLSPTERYNLGGLFACAIERAFDPDFKRLRAVLRHLDLPSQEKDNLLRLSQGFTIPKLFADGVGEHKVSQILGDLITFASAEGAYEKKWRDEIRQVGMWLGFFPQQVEQIEQKVLAKR
jgi:hypothetical protein